MVNWSRKEETQIIVILFRVYYTIFHLGFALTQKPWFRVDVVFLNSVLYAKWVKKNSTVPRTYI